MVDPTDPQANGAQPPRPGEEVPEGGLDPAQVFSAPPSAGAQGGAAQGAGTGDDATPQKDSGPPPPPPGSAATTDMGYDEEDLKILQEVGDYRFGSITGALANDNIVVPAHPEATFDEQEFLNLLRGSISLTRDEKWRIIQAIPKLSQFQIDELQKILAEEKRRFSELSPKHLRQLMQLEKTHAQDWQDLQSISVQEKSKEQEKEQAEEIRKQLGL